MHAFARGQNRRMERKGKATGRKGKRKKEKRRREGKRDLSPSSIKRIDAP